MKKELLAAILVGGIMTSASGATVTQKTLYEAKASMSTRADDNKVVLTVDYDLPISQELYGLYCYESTGADTDLYYGLSEEEDSNVYEFHLPEGTYDFYVGAVLGDYEGMMVLTLDGIKVEKDMDLSLASSSATYRTDIHHIAPDGSELRMLYDVPAGTVPSAQLIHALRHNDQLVVFNSHSTDGPGMEYFITNNPDSRYVSTRLDVMATPFGSLNMVIPVDYSKEYSSTSTENWQMASEKFASTPANRKLQDYYESCGEPDYFYGFATTLMIYNGNLIGNAGIGMFDKNCSTSTVGVWIPDNYNDSFELWPIPTGSALTGWGSDIAGLPLRRSEHGLRQVGVNVVGDRLTYLRYESPAPGPEYSAFSGGVPDAELGNCVPLLVLLPDEEYFEFSFTGRHGESISQASAYYSIPSEEYWDEIFGKPLCDVKFYRDDELICSSRNEFPYDVDWGEPADYRLEISTDNVLIDGITPGYVKAIHNFGESAADLIPPTMTSLRILDADGNINDCLPSKAGSKVVFTGGHFAYRDNWEQMFAYEEFSAVECTGVEYAPRGSENYSPLEVKETGSPILPGYGNCFEADLDGVSADSTDGWYDLKITIRDESGSTQTQIISPAFNIPEMSGIDMIKDNGYNIDVDSAETEIFTIEGMKVNRQNLTPGIYIVRSANKTTKIKI